MKSLLRLLTASILSVAALHAQEPPANPAAAATPAAPKEKLPPQVPDVAAPKMDPKSGKPHAGFMQKHERYLQIAKEGDVDLLFLGDSITEGWAKQKAIWEKAFGAYKAAHFGISGDRTQNVLWRIENGELDGIQPKTIVLMIGTNNSGADPAEQIVKGITRIVEMIRQKQPQAKVLLLAVFPRGENADNPQRLKLKEVNSMIAKLDDGEHVFFLDIGDKFLQPDGPLTKEVMPDLLHLSTQGYQIWADAITPKLEELMK